jgi:methionyl aminopeptidase
MRSVPDHIVRPDYVSTGSIATSTEPQVLSGDALDRMRHACAVAAQVLERTGSVVAPGITTQDIDAVAHKAYIELGSYPSTLGYKGYPKSICSSVNGVVCHGIPDDRPLAEGDIVNVDITAFIDGMHGDTSATFFAGAADEPTAALVATTREALLRGIAAIKPGEPLQRIAAAIEPFAHSRGFAVVREYGGHGIGETFHAAPHVYHHLVADDRVVVEPGMTFTVEPMLMSGSPHFTRAPDGWTEHTDDDWPSAQFEHTVRATDDGVEILTLTEAGTSAAGTLAEIRTLSGTDSTEPGLPRP